MSFLDFLLIDRVGYSVQSGPSFYTEAVELRSGHDRRNAAWEQPKQRLDVPFQNLTDVQVAQLRDAFMVCQGRAHSFRFFDRLDYELDEQVIGTADGSTDQELQLVKTYTVYGETTTRDITKPVDSTRDYGRGENVLGAAPAMVIKADGVPITASINYLTGVVTFTASAGEVITASGWFDVPVRFEQDELFISRDELNAHNASVSLIEDRGA